MKIETYQNTASLAPFIAGIKTALFALACSCLWAGSTVCPLHAQQPGAEAAPERLQPDPVLERIWDLLSADRATEIDEATLAASGSTGTPSIRIELAAQLLHLDINGREVLTCPIASGRPSSRTPRGSFSVAATFENESIPYRGVFLGADGNVLMGDVDRRQDPMPVGASFQPRPVAVIIQLSGEGPTIQSGIATRSATTSGDIRIPATAATTMLRLIDKGTAVTIQ